MTEAPAAPLVLGVHHTGVTVTDIERSIAFYRDVLGFVLVQRQEGQRPYLATITGFAEVYLKTAFLKVRPEDPHILELLEYTSHPGAPSERQTNRPAVAHLCLRVADIQRAYAEWSARGVVFVAPPTPITSGVNAGALGCYLRDPDGFTLELLQPAPGA